MLPTSFFLFVFLVLLFALTSFFSSIAQDQLAILGYKSLTAIKPERFSKCNHACLDARFLKYRLHGSLSFSADVCRFVHTKAVISYDWLTGFAVNYKFVVTQAKGYLPQVRKTESGLQTAGNFYPIYIEKR
jgi:hypothetical protein